MAAGPDSGWWTRLRDWARRMKRDVVALWLAARDPRTPILAKIAAAVVAAYALSPIDLIPDFVPVLGYLDDVIIVPLGIIYAICYGPEAALFSDLFEPRVRYSGISFVYQFSGIFASGITPMIATYLIATGEGSPWYLCAYVVFAALVSMFCARAIKDSRIRG